MSKLKDLRVILVILLVLSWIVAGAGGFIYHTAKTKQLSEKETEIATLQDSINQVGELVTGYSVASEVSSGKKIEETDLVPIQVPISMATNLVQNKDELLGKYFRLDLTQGSPITSDVVYEEEITDDLRLFDVMLDTIPVGLSEGTYVDIRIQLPMGEDFIAIPHKKVHQINAGVLKIAFTENDIHTYNSMLIDSLIYPGTTLYATEYIEGGVQTPANAYYPTSSNVIAIAQRDPNLLNAIKSDIIQRRTNLEATLDGLAVDEEKINSNVEKLRKQYQSSLSSAEQDFAKRLEEQQKAEEEANGSSDKSKSNTSGNMIGK